MLNRNFINTVCVAISALTLSAGVAQAAAGSGDLMKDFDALSGNDTLLERAKSLNPEMRTEIVQQRAVQRPKRFEFSPLYTNVFGGDAYVKSQGAGFDIQYHLNYRWSLGARYNHMFNELTTEGKNLINNKALKATVPAMDYVKSEAIGTVSWYPIYGKFNMYDLGVVHFDFYALLGGGQMALESGSSTATTAGGGFAFWVSQHLTSRFEVRWLGYKAERTPNKPEDMNLTVGTFSVGYLL